MDEDAYSRFVPLTMLSTLSQHYELSLLLPNQRHFTSHDGCMMLKSWWQDGRVEKTYRLLVTATQDWFAGIVL
ncbi:hypothetical protein [Desulfonatronum thiosulfatophilum]|uniref:hypothetical protein n=1 Tax=Desulfonatronum thiosulfatophilum TaxID=617002 RepID=UPI0011145DCC|nr:hypothetical protein [Desulfonatronum thiosulfatophilum]